MHSQPVKMERLDLAELAGEVLREEEMIHPERTFLPRWGEEPVSGQQGGRVRPGGEPKLHEAFTSSWAAGRTAVIRVPGPPAVPGPDGAAAAPGGADGVRPCLQPQPGQRKAP